MKKVIETTLSAADLTGTDAEAFVETALGDRAEFTVRSPGGNEGSDYRFSVPRNARVEVTLRFQWEEMEVYGEDGS